VKIASVFLQKNKSIIFLSLFATSKFMEGGANFN